jgi:hypothetical protein
MAAKLREERKKLVTDNKKDLIYESSMMGPYYAKEPSQGGGK